MMASLSLMLLGLAMAGDSKVEFENDWVRVVRVQYAAHEKTDVHDHPAVPTVYVYLTNGGRLKLGHDGEPPVVRPAVRLGGIRFQKGVAERHWVEELDGVASQYLRVELKTEPVDLPNQDVRRAPEDRTPYESGMLRIERVTCQAHSACPAAANAAEPAVVVTGESFVWQQAGSVPLRNNSNSSVEQVRVELKTGPAKPPAAKQG